MAPKRDDQKKKKLGTKLEDDELFKQIGGQLDANFDYSEWQRTAKIAESKNKAKKIHSKVTEGGSFLVKPHVASKAGPSTWATQLTEEASESVVCEHGKPKKYSINQAFETAQAKKRAEHIKILNLRIQARKQTIAEYKKREAELLIANIKMKEDIINEESEAHENVKKLLRKYEKYRGGINTLNDQFTEEYRDAKTARELTEIKVEKELAELQKKVDEMDKRLKEKQHELHVLVNYKDKEYAVKSLRILELQTQIAELELNQKEEQDELCHIVETEIEKFKKEENRIKSYITENAAEEVLAKMHPSLKEMAMQNNVMSKEIEFHTKEIAELQEQNEELQEGVQRLLRDPKTNIRQQMFPEFFPTKEKCTPDMDVILDIPVQESLPI
ncbi:hypothetical protein LSH36_438g02040 [Paralvinella palmiformis]|uniref:Uncharacterized protein n=1 Tax=Paralvinella palmiformis TaxID=53620 RepID=A0AAD9JAY7_9ANNE|nr:hypothetical protein LSH36_438g02040 [Paralvinella palmiformis]